MLHSHTDERFLLLYGTAISFQHVREIFQPKGEGFSQKFSDIIGFQLEFQGISVRFQLKGGKIIGFTARYG